ncbi:MAG: protein kinase [Myxococcales bacterium]|nr:protein kinase [Myxococcales bacterium]
MNSCLSEEVLQSFSARGLDAEQEAQVNAHVADCSDCRMVLAEFGRGLSGLAQSEPAAPEPARPLLRGSSLGRYLILEQVGSGGMGAVYGAYDAELDRRVALKLLHQSGGEQHRARLVQEARAMARLNHPNVAAIYGVESAGERLFVSMEFIVGETVRQWAARERRSVPEVLDVFLQAGRGLEAAHHAGLVHRDFKPDNIMVRPDARVSVLDFGLARAIGASVASEAAARPVSSSPLTQTGTVLGTLRYMPPEQRQGRPTDARADQFAFCVSLYETLHGALPGEPSTKTPSVPVALARGLQRGMAEHSADRYPDMHSLLLQLERVRAPTRRGQWAVVALLAVLAIAASVVVALRSRAAMCDGADDEVAQVWNPALATQLERAFADGRGGAVRTSLEAYGVEWTRAHRQACEATRLRGAQSEDLLDRRMLCLSTRKAALGATASLLAERGATAQGSAVMLAGLPRIADCADVRGLLETVPPPGDPAVRARLEQTRTSLARANALMALSRTDDAFAPSLDVLKAAEEVGYAPLLAEALLLRAFVLRSRGAPVEADVLARRAVLAAKEGRDARLEALAWGVLAENLGLMLRRASEAEWFYRVTEVSLRLLPDSELLEANRLRSYGQAHDLVGDLPTSIAAFQASIALYEKHLPLPLPGPLATTHRRLSESLVKAQRFEEAAVAVERAMRLAEHDTTGSSQLDRCLIQKGEVLRLWRRYDEAREPLVQGLALARKSGNVFSLSTALQAFAALERDVGNYPAARTLLQQSVSLVEAMPDPNPYLGQALGELGRVQLLSGERADAERSLRMAVRLFDRFGAKGVHETMPPRTALARVLLETGQQEEANSRLEQLVGFLAEDPASPVALAPMRFDLATVLWDSGGERRLEARSLAEAARDASLGALRSDVDHWLATHPPTGSTRAPTSSTPR